jgi:hypothetical protein
MAIYTWSGATSGATWGTTGNWSPTGIPGIADDAIFTSAGSTCTVAATASISTINFGGTAPTAYNKTFIIGAAAELVVVGPTMTLSNSMSFTGLGPAGDPASDTTSSSIRIAGAPTLNIIANGATIHRLQNRAGSAASKSYIITGTCHISEVFASGGIPSTNGNFSGDPIVCEKDIRLGYVSLINGSTTFYWRPRAGTTGYFRSNWSFEGGGNTTASFQSALIINGPGHIHFVQGLVKGGTMTYVSAASVTTSANGLTGRHSLGILSGSTWDTNTILWDNVDLWSGAWTLVSDLRVGGNFETAFNALTIGGTGRSILLEGIKANANGTAATYMGSQSFQTFPPLRMAPGSIRVIGTGTRVFRNLSTGTGWVLMNTNLVLGMSGGTISFTGTLSPPSVPVCPFYFSGGVGGVTSSFSNVSTNTTIENSGIVTIADGTPTLVLSMPGITISTLSKGAGSNTVINSLLYTNSIVHGGGSRYSGTAGFYTNNFTHPGGGQSIILGTTGTYTVASGFTMIGSNGTAGRAVLESDTRADFTGSVSFNSLTVIPPQPQPFVGGELGVAGYTAGQSIPLGLANILPGRPDIISGTTGSWSITPSVSPGYVGAMSVGKKAKFFLGTGATQNVRWATTRDIDSLGPGGLYQSISAQFSFNDSSGVTGPTLLRTLNWGTLVPPTRPSAFTFVT